MNRLVSFTLVTFAILVVAACSGGSSRPTVGPSIDPEALTISANGLRFSTNTLSAPADEPFQIVFDNQESAPHNVAIYREAAGTDKVFVPEPFSGPAVVAYDVPALEAGTYAFRCDVHPDMAGQLTVG